MIVLQVRPIGESIRFRWSEWGCAGVMIGYGATLLLPGNSFDNPSWAVLKQWAPEDAWGTMLFILGIIRVGILTRNGRWRYFHQARILFAWVSCFIWASLLWALASVNTGYIQTGISVYLGYLCLDLGTIYISSYDAERQKEALRRGAA